MASVLTNDDYARLLAVRSGLRRFLHWSEEEAKRAGLNPAQHQLLLAIRGHAGPEAPTVGDVAGYLLVRHNSAVGLSQRTEALGLIRRAVDRHDHRVVRLELTRKGERALERLTEQHLEELQRLADDMRSLWDGLGDRHGD